MPAGIERLQAILFAYRVTVRSAATKELPRLNAADTSLIMTLMQIGNSNPVLL
jgi:hypothetical protein